MGAKVQLNGNTVSQPDFLRTFGGREHMAEFPARLNPDDFVDDAGVKVKLTAAALMGLNEVQTLTVGGTPTGGTFTLVSAITGFSKKTADNDFEGTTVAIAYNATAATVQAALETILGVGNVYVTGSAGGPWTVNFIGELAFTNVAALTRGTNSLTGGTSPDVTVSTTVAGSAGATSLTVVALAKPLKKGSVIRFKNGAVVRLTAAAAAGATSLTVDQVTQYLAIGDTAYYSETNRKTILAGRLVGRTYTEAEAGDPFGYADVANDDEIYLTIFTLDDANENPDCEFVRHGSTIAINYLPGYDDLTDAELTWLRANYVCILGHGG